MKIDQDYAARLRQRIELKLQVDEDTGCWNWTGYVGANGYGVIMVQRVRTQASRAMYFAVNPETDTALQVNHHCDNPRCCNPDHLYAGSQVENMQDCLRRGRLVSGFSLVPPRCGEDHHGSRLTEFEVRAIRDSDEKQAALADRYGVSQSRISAIKNRQSWRHVK